MAFVTRDLDALDRNTAELVIKLQIRETRNLMTGGDVGSQVALRLHVRELKNYLQSRGVPTDERSIEEPAAVGGTQSNTISAVGSTTTVPKVNANTAAPKTAPTAPAKPVPPVQPVQPVQLVQPIKEPEGECLICFDDKPLSELYIVQTNKGLFCAGRDTKDPHRWCEGCVEKLFRDSLTDKSLYPPKCCGNRFDFGEMKPYLTHHLIIEVEEKLEELEDSNPIYCHVPNCSVYIGAENREDTIAKCPEGHEPTCRLCKAAQHTGEKCPKDEGMEQLKTLAKDKKWQTCKKCNAVVEINTGCNHMTCRCGHNFCYVCGATWVINGHRQCRCSQFTEEHLYARAEVVHRREGGVDGAMGLERMAEHLRRQHHCREHRYGRVNGQLNCDGCGDLLTRFIYRCRGCHLQQCYRCRYNRGGN